MEYLPALSLLLIAVLAIPLSIIDFRTHRLPNRFTYPAIAVSAITLLLAGMLTADVVRLAIAVAIGGSTWFLGYLLANVNGIGMGDVKLLTAINLSIAWFSPFSVLVILAIGFSLASIASLGLMAIGKANLKTAIAMGPFLLFGYGLVALDLGFSAVTSAGGS